MSLYSTLSQFLPAIAIGLAIWFMINMFLIPEQLQTGEFNIQAMMLPIIILAGVVTILIVTNMYGV